MRRAIAAVVLALVAVGCGRSTPSIGVSNAGTGPPKASPAPRVPNPFKVTARFTSESLGLDDPRALAVGPDGNLYVTDRSQRVTVVSPGGKVLRRWGKPGTGPGEFRFISGDPTDPNELWGHIAVGSDGKVYVADSGNSRVQVFAAEGRFVRQFGGHGSGKAQFVSTFDVAVDDAGSVYVQDGQTRTVSKFAPDGRVIWRFGGPGSSFVDPYLGNVDSHDRLVMLNGAGKVLYVDGHGHVADSFAGSGCEVSVDALGYTYVNRDANGCRFGLTQVFDRAHRLVGVWSGPDDSLSSPIAFGPNDEAFAIGGYPDGSSSGSRSRSRHSETIEDERD